MERETKIVTSPSGNKIELKTYITGREKRELTNIYFESKIDYNAETKDVKGFNAAIVDKAQDLAFRLIIVSIDGKKDGADGFSVVSAILDMRSADYEFIVAEVNKVTEDKGFEQKKTI